MNYRSFAPQRECRQGNSFNDNELLVRLASLWSYIKSSTGKMTAVGSSIQYVVDERELSVAMLPITFPHLDRLQRLERLHNDSFYRLIIAQALENNYPSSPLTSSLETMKSMFSGNSKCNI